MRIVRIPSTLLWNYGAYLFNEEGGSAVPNEKTKAMIEKYADLYNKEIIPPSATTWDRVEITPPI